MGAAKLSEASLSLQVTSGLGSLRQDGQWYDWENVQVLKASFPGTCPIVPDICGLQSLPKVRSSKPVN